MKRRALLKGVAAGVAAALGLSRDLGARVLPGTECRHHLVLGDPSADYYQCLSCGAKVPGTDVANGARVPMVEDPLPHPLYMSDDDREYLSDLIYDISPAETPFCNHHAVVKSARGRTVDVWETDFGRYEVPRHPLTG